MKINWVSTSRRCCLAAREMIEDDDQSVPWRFVTEENMVEVANWCHQNNCGRRISYDMIQFKNKKEMTALLLRGS